MCGWVCYSLLVVALLTLLLLVVVVVVVVAVSFYLGSFFLSLFLTPCRSSKSDVNRY